MKKAISFFILLFALSMSVFGQSRGFSFGKWSEIHNAILKELNYQYVDSLPVDRIERKAIDAMLGNLDPYTVYIPAEENDDLEMIVNKSYGGIGAIIYKPKKDDYVIINEPYENSPAAKAGLRCGDRIMSVDGKSTIGLTASESSSAMKGKPGSVVKFHVKKAHTGQEVDLSIERQQIHLPDIEYYGMLDGTTGYILQSGFTQGVGDQVRKAVKDLKGQGMQRLVLDLRGNGGGLLSEAVEIVSIFVPKGSVVVSIKGNEMSPASNCKTEQQPLDTQMPLIVLVDNASASASEIVAGALQDYDRATIMGGRTYGKGLVQNIRNLPYGGKLKLTVAKYYTPSGRCVQAKDYAHRKEDGSVGAIPDSLTHEFKTAGGRIVRDGGGITPDVKLDIENYSRITYSVVLSGVLDDYIIDYVSRHKSIAPLETFHFNDYEDFVKFAKTKEFDYRSSARTYYDKMVEELKADKLEEAMKPQLEALKKSLDMEKEAFLRLKKSEIIPFIEEELAVRYYFQQAGVQVRLRYDKQLEQALKSPLITQNP